MTWLLKKKWLNKKQKIKLINVTHNISPSSGSLPSEVSILVSFTACLAFFLDFFPCKKRNNDQEEKNPSISDKRKEEGYSGDAIQNIISHPRTTTGQQTPDTRTSMLRPNLFISETTSTVQDSLNGTGPIWKHHFYLTYTRTSPHFSTLRTVCHMKGWTSHRPIPNALLQDSAAHSS